MVYTLIDHRNDAIKCSKLKWNHEPQASSFTAKFEDVFLLFDLPLQLQAPTHPQKFQKQNNRLYVTCYVISMVSTHIDHSL